MPTFSRTVWMLYGDAKDLVLWYYQVPFYKDRAFREVSVRCMLDALGAARAPSPPPPPSPLRPG